MESDQIIISPEEFLKELVRFKPWPGPGPYLARIIEEKDDDLIPLGSGGLLEYKGRYFVLSNEHVIKGIVDLLRNIILPYTSFDGISYKLEILSVEKDSEKDIAVFEVVKSEQFNNSNHLFLPYDYIENDVKSYAEKTNFVFCHGYPAFSTIVDSIKKEIEAETFPYCTFISEFDKNINSLFIHVNEERKSENGDIVDIPIVCGMSGSFVYGYYFNETPQYKCLGILTNWHQSEKLLEVYPINEFIDFIEEKFFGNHVLQF